jgi:hypothetical protein
MTEVLTVAEIDCSTGQETIRPLTQSEIEQYQIDQANSLAWEQERQEKAQRSLEIKQSALSKLSALGLTEEEAKSIVGLN